jgi:hypothetical protein
MILDGDRIIATESSGVSFDRFSLNADSLNPQTSNTITIPTLKNLRGTDTGSISSPGNVIQCVILRYDAQPSLTTGTGAAGVEITGMRATITPKFSTSMIYGMFQVHGEGSAGEHNLMFNVFKNGSVPTGTYAGFNTVTGNNVWSGIAMCSPYDSAQNSSSTPFTQAFFYHDFPATTSTLTYSPGVKSTDSTSRTFFVNRCGDASFGLGSSSYEVGISYSIIWEIAQ